MESRDETRGAAEPREPEVREAEIVGPSEGAQAGTGGLPPTVAAELARLRQMANLLDSQWQVPGTRFRFGLDPILGLVPGVGDVASLGMSLYAWSRAKHLHLDSSTRWRMLGNVVVDTVLGSIPVIGQVFDFVLKANRRNLKLLERKLKEKHGVG